MSVEMMNVNLNMERGWPCKEQLNLSLPMLDLVRSDTVLEYETDYRGGGVKNRFYCRKNGGSAGDCAFCPLRIIRPHLPWTRD